MLPPVVRVGPGQIASGHLLEHVRYMQGLQQRQVCGLQAVFLSDLVDEAGPRKGPLIGTDGEEEGRKTVLSDCIQQVQMLPLPVGGGKRLLLESGVGTAARGPSGVDGSSDRLEEPPVIVVLEQVVIQAEV